MYVFIGKVNPEDHTQFIERDEGIILPFDDVLPLTEKVTYVILCTEGKNAYHYLKGKYYCTMQHV